MKTMHLLGMTALTLATLPLNLNAELASAGNALVGPLFYTPLERDAIDRGNLAVDSASDPSAGNRPPPAMLRFDGRVERTDGRPTAWVSGRPLERIRPALPDTRLSLQGERLRIETQQTTRWLKAGEQFVPEQPVGQQ